MKESSLPILLPTICASFVCVLRLLTLVWASRHQNQMGHRVWSCRGRGHAHVGASNREMLYTRYAIALLARAQNRWKKWGYQIRLGCITFMPFTKHNLFHNIDLILFLLRHAHTHTHTHTREIQTTQRT